MATDVVCDVSSLSVMSLPVRRAGHERVVMISVTFPRSLSAVAVSVFTSQCSRWCRNADLSDLWDSCLEEHAKDVAERPVTRRVMNEVFGAGNRTALPCLCHVQACGKKRRSDNAKAQLENAETRYVERSRLASVCVPAIAARALQQAESELTPPSDEAEKLLYLESGGEDMPDAFRSIPPQQWHRTHNNVMLRNPQSGQLRFVRALAALFGQGSAFFNLERRLAFLEAAPRRLLWRLWAMCVDDEQLTEPPTGRGPGQELIHTFFDELRFGLKADKRRWLATQSVSLGTEHALHTIPSELVVEFWPREGIIDEIPASMDRFRSTRQCPPGDAAKFWRLPGFAARAEYGQLGRTAMRPWTQCQTTDVASWHLAHTMERSTDSLRCSSRSGRGVASSSSRRNPCVVVASETRVEPGSLPGGGVLSTTRTP